MELSREQHNDVVVIILDGDMMGGPEAMKVMEEIHSLLDAHLFKVIIDLGKVRRMNSSGMGILINALTTFKQNGGQLKLANPTAVVEKILNLAKLTEIFECYATLDGALNSF